MVGTDVVFMGNELWANNVSGFDSKWEGGGIKIGESDGVTMADNHVHHNIGPGLWCDINCRNVTYEGNTVEYNQDAGIFHEISFKAVIRNNTVRYNGLKTTVGIGAPTYKSLRRKTSKFMAIQSRPGTVAPPLSSSTRAGRERRSSNTKPGTTIFIITGLNSKASEAPAVPPTCRKATKTIPL